MPCDEYRALVEKRGEGSLPDEQKRLLEDHLPTCEECRKAVALQRLDDAAVHDALLGFPTRAAKEQAGAGNYGRIVLVSGVVIGLVLLGLWALYGSFQRAAEREIEKRQAAAALDRKVMPRSLRRPLPVVLADFADQVEAPVVLDDGSPAPEEVTFTLEGSIRLRSALSLLAELYDVKFRVGADRVLFPTAGPDVVPETRDLRTRLRGERATLSYSGDRLEGALQFIDDLKGIRILIAPSAVEQVAAAPAHLEVKDRRLDEILTGLLEPVGLRWDVRHEVVFVGKP